MANKLNVLESKKLFREFNYLMSDVEFKNEFTREYGQDFELEIRRMLEEEPIIKQTCKDIFGTQLDVDVAPAVDVNIELSESTEIIVFAGEKISDEPIIKLESDNQTLKELYRKIVQKTHPDKINSDVLNDFYVRAVEANKRGDILTIYAISSELGIKFEISDEEVIALRAQIQMIKMHQASFEKTHFWAWANSKQDVQKKEIIRHFLINNAPVVKSLFS
jgi:hypothetical protein